MYYMPCLAQGVHCIYDGWLISFFFQVSLVSHATSLQVKLCWHMQAMMLLSEDQIQDVMFLRHVFYVEGRQFDMQRAALSASMAEQSPNHIANVAKISAIANQLRENAAEHHTFLQTWAGTIYYGVGHEVIRAMHGTYRQCTVCKMLYGFFPRN